MKRFFLIPLLIVALNSCAPVQDAVNRASAPVKASLAKIDKSRFKVPSFLKKTPPVVEVKKQVPASKAEATKPKLLASKTKKKSSPKKQPPKKEKALVPKDFDPSDLEVGGQLTSFGILPSIGPGGSNIIDELDDSASLPPDIANLPPIPSLPITPKVPKVQTKVTPNDRPNFFPLPDSLKPAGPVPPIKSGE